MPGKPITEQGLLTDLDYVLNDINCHWVLETVCPRKDGLKVLEAGCGSGKLGYWYAIKGAKVVLMDLDEEVLKYTRALGQILLQAIRRDDGEGKETRNFCVRLVQGNLHHMDKAFGAEFDLVFNEGVPHQWPRTDWRRQHCINQMVKVTKRGGIVCVIGSNALCPEMEEFAKQVNHTYMGMPKKQEPFSPQELMRRLRQAGLDGETIRCVPVDSATWEKSMLIGGWGTKP